MLSDPSQEWHTVMQRFGRLRTNNSDAWEARPPTSQLSPKIRAGTCNQVPNDYQAVVTGSSLARQQPSLSSAVTLWRPDHPSARGTCDSSRIGKSAPEPGIDKAFVDVQTILRRVWRGVADKQLKDSPMGVIRKLRRSLKRGGLVKTIALCIRNVCTVSRQETPSRFDALYDLETDGRVELGDLKIDSPSDVWGQAYAATPTELIARVLDVLPPPEGYTFVDLGCGKGRVVLMAAQKNFTLVIGVEFARQLCATAQANLAKFKPHIMARDVRIVCDDAASFEFPSGPLIAYCYHAFMKEVLVRVLDRLIHREDETIFAYYNPQYEELFKKFRVLHAEGGLRIWSISAAGARVDDLAHLE
jgi:hypothetical protein